MVLIHIEYGAHQSGSTSCSFYTTVTTFKTCAFSHAPTQPSPTNTLKINYTHLIHHHDGRSTLQDFIIHIVSYCDDSTRYTVALTLEELIP